MTFENTSEFNRSFMPRKVTIYESDRADESESPRETKNIVVFGESGVGKSSLINLLVGEKVSKTSSGAQGCTLDYKRHLLKLGNQQFVIWDTAGLDEGTQGSVPADQAEAYLKQLLHELVKNNGVDLLVYCVRGSRIRSALLANYHIFYSAICRKKVPIAIVVTGLENQEGDMETWWGKNEAEFLSLKMHFDNHACVTTLGESPVENPLLLKRRETSRMAVIEMITTSCRTQQWNPPERSWFESAYSDIRAILFPREDHPSRLPAIIMCETFRANPGRRSTRRRSFTFQNPVTLSHSVNSFSFRSPVFITNDTSRSKLPFNKSTKRTPERMYRVYQVHPGPVPSPGGTDEETSKVTAVKRSADLLIFCVRMAEDPQDVKFQWDYFNFTYGGDLAPQVVVVVGAPNQSAAEIWWKQAVGTFVKNGVHIAHWPSDTTEMTGFEDKAPRERLQHLIEDRCIDCSKVTSARNEKLFRRSLFLDISNLWGKPGGDGKGDVPDAGPDLLTRAEVWYDIPERSSTVTSPTSPAWSPFR